MAKPLAGIKVIELANFIARPLCGTLLADMGADVIKVEPPKGDMARATPPIRNGESVSFVSLNRNKRSLVLDLKRPEAAEILLKLAAQSDVFAEAYRPGALDKLGLGGKQVKAVNPRIVYTSVSGFGQSGPYRRRAGVNLIIEAFSGMLSVTGEPGKMPMRREGFVADVSLIETAIAASAWEAADYLASGKIPQPLGNKHRLNAPYQLFECKDGRYLAIGTPNDQLFKNLMTVLGLQAHIDDPRYVSYASRKANEDALMAVVEPAVCAEFEGDRSGAEHAHRRRPAISVLQQPARRQAKPPGKIDGHVGRQRERGHRHTLDIGGVYCCVRKRGDDCVADEGMCRLSGLRTPCIGRLADADDPPLLNIVISGWQSVVLKSCGGRRVTLAFPHRDASPAQSNDMIRAAIIGLGRWGRSLVDSVHGTTDDIRFVAGHTRTRAKAKEFCREKDVRLVDDFATILSDPSIDAVVLATPHSRHAEQIKQAAAAGKHILVEKPITLDHASAVAATEAARKAGVTLAVGYCRRFHPSFGEIRQRLHDGRLGKIVGLVAQHTTSTQSFIAPENWRADPDEAPAGAMTAVGLHALDLMIEFAGRVGDVQCVTGLHGDGQADDTSTVLMRFANGATGTIFCSVATATNFSFSAYGSLGLAEVRGAALQQFRFVPMSQQAPTGPVLAPPDQLVDHSGFNMLRAELVEFAHSIRDKHPYPVGIDDVLHGMAVFDACVLSAKTDHIVAIAER